MSASDVQQVIENKQREELLRHLLGSIADRKERTQDGDGTPAKTAKALQYAGEFIPELNEMYAQTNSEADVQEERPVGASVNV